MKFPSISSLIENGLSTFKRFPLVITAAVLCAICNIQLSHLAYNANDSHEYLLRITESSYLAMLLLLTLTIYAERKVLAFKGKILYQFAGVAIAVSYYFFLAKSSPVSSVIQFFLFILGLHLLIAFIPFTDKGMTNGFWQYNKTLFLRILTSALYTCVLYIGLALAILAVEKLFNVNVNNKLYFDLWIVLTNVFNTWFFLSGFPSDFSELEKSSDYPKGLKIFTQYILLPIITIYLLILYAYMFKIVFNWQWPVGWVSYLVLGFSVAGIFSLLLIHPVRNDSDNKWVINYSKFFYFALFPLLILLFLAIQRRVKDYGVTELRYFVMVLAVWLLFIALYFLVSKSKSIKIIPQTLCLLAFACSFGPWSAFSISRNSQTKILMVLANQNKILVNGKFVKPVTKLSFKSEKQLSSIFDYMIEYHGYTSLQPYFVQNLDSLYKGQTNLSWNSSEKLLGLLNMQHVNKWDIDETEPLTNTINTNGKPVNISFSARPNENDHSLNISGYDFLIENFFFSIYNSSNSSSDKAFVSDKDSVKIIVEKDHNSIKVQYGKEEAVSFNLIEFVQKHLSKTNARMIYLPTDDLRLNSSNNKIQAELVFKNLNVERTANSVTINSFTCMILVGTKKAP